MSAEIIKTLRWVERYLHQEGYDAYLDVGRAADMLERREELANALEAFASLTNGSKFDLRDSPQSFISTVERLNREAADLLERRKG